MCLIIIIVTARRLARTHTAHDNVQGDSRGTLNYAHPQIFIRPRSNYDLYHI